MRSEFHSKLQDNMHEQNKKHDFKDLSLWLWTKLGWWRSQLARRSQTANQSKRRMDSWGARDKMLWIPCELISKLISLSSLILSSANFLLLSHLLSCNCCSLLAEKRKWTRRPEDGEKENDKLRKEKDTTKVTALASEGQVLTLERQQKENERKIAAGKMKWNSRRKEKDTKD